MYDETSEDEDVSPRGSASRRERQKKQRLKDKAEKMFARQFGGSEPASEGGSRAAVYKGEMGKSHKRAFSNLSGAPNGRSAQSAGKAKKQRAPRMTRIAVAVGCMVCAVAVAMFLYPTARQVYVESREESRLQAEYDALMQRNEAMQSRIDYLQTEEGIKDAARQQLGWVEKGDIAVAVDGLSENVGNEATVNIQIASGSVPAPETWYSPVLDAVFGYSYSMTPPAQQNESSQPADGQDGAQG